LFDLLKRKREREKKAAAAKLRFASNKMIIHPRNERNGGNNSYALSHIIILPLTHSKKISNLSG